MFGQPQITALIFVTWQKACYMTIQVRNPFFCFIIFKFSNKKYAWEIGEFSNDYLLLEDCTSHIISIYDLSVIYLSIYLSISGYSSFQTFGTHLLATLYSHFSVNAKFRSLIGWELIDIFLYSQYGQFSHALHMHIFCIAIFLKWRHPQVQSETLPWNFTVKWTGSCGPELLTVFKITDLIYSIKNVEETFYITVKWHEDCTFTTAILTVKLMYIIATWLLK